MKLEKLLVPSIILLSIAMVLGSYFVSTSILTLADSKQQVALGQNENEDIMSISEAAAYLKIPEDRLESLVEDYELWGNTAIPFYTIDDEVMFSKTALSNWIVQSSECHLSISF